MNDDDSSGTESNAIKNDMNPFYDNDSSDMKCNGLDDGDGDSSSSGSSDRPHFTRDSSGSDSDYHRYMKSNFITEVYHTKDYDYSTNDDESNASGVGSGFSRNSSRSSSFTSAAGDFVIDGIRESALGAGSGTGSGSGAGAGSGIAVADDKHQADSSSGSEENRSNRRRPQRLSQAEEHAQGHALTLGQDYKTVSTQKSVDTEDDCDAQEECKREDEAKDHNTPPGLPVKHPSERKVKEKQSSLSSSTSSSSEFSQEEDQQTPQQPTKPPKPVKRSASRPSASTTSPSTAAPAGTPVTDPADTSTVQPLKTSSLEITVTSTERSLVTSGVEQSFYLDGNNKCLVSSATAFHASTVRDCEDMFLSQFIPSPKQNVKSLSWHISITDNAARSNGYQLSIYKVLLRRSKSWCGGNNWALFIDGKHVANGKVPLFTMSSEISFEMPSSCSSEEEAGGEGGRQTAKIEIKRKAWYRRKLTYKFKIGGNEYPTFYAQAVDLFQSLPPASPPQKTQELEPEPLPSASPEVVSRATDKPTTPAAKRGSNSNPPPKALSSTASTLKSSATASASTKPGSGTNSLGLGQHPKAKSITRLFSPAQMLITIPSTNTEVSASGKRKIYYQILIRIPALPQPIVVERRFKHFSQLVHLLRGELALTLEESVQGGGGQENKGVSNACQAKLNQFPTLPSRVYNPMVNQLRPDFIKTRRLALQSFLIELMSYDPKIVHCSEFLGFLGLHPITCTSVLKG